MSKFAKILRYNLMTKDKTANIKLQSIPAFFADTRADAQEKMRVRLQFFFVKRNATIRQQHRDFVIHVYNLIS